MMNARVLVSRECAEKSHTDDKRLGRCIFLQSRLLTGLDGSTTRLAILKVRGFGRV